MAKALIPRRVRPLAKRLYHRALPENALVSRLARQLDSQAAVCRRTGSPFYGVLLARTADDVRAGGPARSVLRSVGQTASGADDALPLQLMGGVHRLVLQGRLPELSAYYPSVGGTGDAEAAWPAFRTALETRAADVTEFFHHAVQTNEVGRCPILLSSFHLVVRETGLPLRLLEIGASAGLNLLLDRYRYEGSGEPWGDPDSPVRFTEPFLTGRRIVDPGMRIDSRAGCDLAPIDPTTEEGRLELLSYVWADQVERLAALRSALEVAAAAGLRVDRADAAAWLEAIELVLPGAATVVYHSFVEQFFDDDTRTRIRRAIEGAGARATAEAPVAWLRMEWRNDTAETRLRLWPGGDDTLLATSSPHGKAVHWLVE